MNQPRKLISVALFAAVIVFGGRISFSQSPPNASPEQSYEAMLYVILGSDDSSQRGELPKSISSVSKQLREDFSFGSYRVMNTYLGRVANNGSLEYKSVSSLQGVERDVDSPSFLDWQLTGLKAGKDNAGRNVVQMQVFRFGARVPIRFTNVAGDTGKAMSNVNYESVGLTLNRINFTENAPTLIGTISLPKTTGTVFLVLAIRPV